MNPSTDAPNLRPNDLLTFIMALACGIAVANIYYAQPLLDTLAHHFDVGQGSAGIIITMTQLGYATGLILLVPLGDLLERRRLTTAMSVVTVLTLMREEPLLRRRIFYGALGGALGLTGALFWLTEPPGQIANPV